MSFKLNLSKSKSVTNNIAKIFINSAVITAFVILVIIVVFAGLLVNMRKRLEYFEGPEFIKVPEVSVVPEVPEVRVKDSKLEAEFLTDDDLPIQFKNSSSTIVVVRTETCSRIPNYYLINKGNTMTIRVCKIIRREKDFNKKQNTFNEREVFSSVDVFKYKNNGDSYDTTVSSFNLDGMYKSIPYNTEWNTDTIIEYFGVSTTPASASNPSKPSYVFEIYKSTIPVPVVNNVLKNTAPAAPVQDSKNESTSITNNNMINVQIKNTSDSIITVTTQTCELMKNKPTINYYVINKNNTMTIRVCANNLINIYNYKVNPYNATAIASIHNIGGIYASIKANPQWTTNTIIEYTGLSKYTIYDPTAPVTNVVKNPAPSPSYVKPTLTQSPRLSYTQPTLAPSPSPSYVKPTLAPAPPSPSPSYASPRLAPSPSPSYASPRLAPSPSPSYAAPTLAPAPSPSYAAPTLAPAPSPSYAPTFAPTLLFTPSSKFVPAPGTNNYKKYKTNYNNKNRFLFITTDNKLGTTSIASSIDTFFIDPINKTMQSKKTGLYLGKGPYPVLSSPPKNTDTNPLCVSSINDAANNVSFVNGQIFVGTNCINFNINTETNIIVEQCAPFTSSTSTTKSIWIESDA